MGDRPVRCDTTRLRSLLDDLLPEDEQAELAEHLGACDACRRRLEGLAAESLWWDEARQFDGEAAPTSGRETSGDRPGFLGPPAGPGRIGTLGQYEVVEV